MEKMLSRAARGRAALFMVFCMVLALVPSANGETKKKPAKIKKLAIKNSNSKVLVMKKKSKVKLKVAINGKVSKKAWKKVKFHSRNKKIVSVTKKGKMTAKKKGRTTITVKSRTNKKKAVLKVIVGTKVKSVKMSHSRESLNVGSSAQLKAVIKPAKASYRKVRWTSSNAGVATVSKKGYVTAVRPGIANITAISLDGTKKKCVCRVVVVKEWTTKKTTAKPGPTGAAPSGKPSQTSGTSTGKPSTTGTVPTAKPGPTGATPSGEPGPTSGTSTGKPQTTGTVPTAKPTPTPVPTPTPEPQTVMTQNCDQMKTGGSYAGAIDKPFAGVALYGNGDCCTSSYAFEGTNKKYRIILKGASNNDTAAGVSVYVGGVKKGSVSFTGTQLQEKSVDFKMQDTETGNLEIKFLLETDNGSNDTYLNSFTLQYLGDIPEPPAAPVPPAVGAVYTGNYRNMFKELGHSEAEIDAKVNAAWQQLFYGDDENERIYYPVGDDMAYIYTADTDDIRSEGMSYGMMICVQMDKKEEFDRLWKWAKTYMQHKDGEHKNYFAWQCKKDGSIMDRTPASDGDEYFATALLFASARWGNGDGIYNYNEQAQIILDTMLHQADDGQGYNMFDSTYKMPVFCPYGNSATFTDPSYHLPAFYEVWAELAEKDNEFWSEAAQASRAYFPTTTNENTGLGPDYSEFGGAPKRDGNHGDFRFDAWRIASNIACDFAWWGKNTWATTHANTLQAFFTKQGVEDYGNQWSLDGKELDTDHSPGLVAMNAVASLAASDKQTWAFLEDFWNISPTTGKYRYYDGCLYMMGLLHCSGKFRAYFPDGSTPSRDTSGKITPVKAEFDLNEEKSADIPVTLILGEERTLKEIKNGSAVLRQGTDYQLSGTTVTVRKEYLAQLAMGTVVLNFVFDAGKDATLIITVKDTTSGGGGTVSGPFEQISAGAFTASNDVTVQDGIVTFNSTDSWISFTLDFGTDTVKSASVYVQEPNNSGQIFICDGSLSKQVSTIYNLGNGSWHETSNDCRISTGGGHTLYVKGNKAGIKLEWIKFTKN